MILILFYFCGARFFAILDMCQELKVMVKDNTTNGPYDWLVVQLFCQLTNLTFYIKVKGPNTYVLHIINHDHDQRLFSFSIHVSIRDKNWLPVEHAVLQLIRTKLLKISSNQFTKLMKKLMNNQYSQKNEPESDSESISDSESDEI